MYLYSHHGALDFRIVQCRLSILRNDNVPCRYFSNVPVDFKVVQCSLSNLRKRCVSLSIFRVKGPIMLAQFHCLQLLYVPTCLLVYLIDFDVDRP